MKNTIAENIANATITVSSENPIYPFDEALIDSRLSRVGRTITDSGQWILFSFSAAVDVDTVCIFANNFTSGATVKIQANASDIWTSPTIDQSLTFTKDDKKSIMIGRDVGTWSFQFDSTQSYQYWRLYVDDGSNPDDYIEIGFIFLDEYTAFPGMSVNQVFKRQTTSDPQFSTSNQLNGLKRTQYNACSFSFSAITDEERKALDIFFDKTDIVTPYLMLVWENSLDVQRPLYVANTTLPEWRRVEGKSGLLWTTNLEIREVN